MNGTGKGAQANDPLTVRGRGGVGLLAGLLAAGEGGQDFLLCWDFRGTSGGFWGGAAEQEKDDPNGGDTRGGTALNPR